MNYLASPCDPCYSDLRNKVALVTGGGSGIGRGISLRLAAEGMRVFICGRREEKLTETAEAIRAQGGVVMPVATDLSSEDQITALFSRIRAEADGFDLLVHNAAWVRRQPLADTDTGFWRRMFATNTDSAFLLTKQALQLMLPRQEGNLIFISTIGAIRAHQGMMAYDASKGAIDAMVRCLAVELSPQGIRVNGIAPGPIRRHEPQPADDPARMRQPYIPMRRYGTPAEIGAAVAFLASQQSSYITGQVICVDGGATAQLAPPGIWI